jgi:predicted DCC family thiol-disulfide oxidoreductase YuxK
MVSAPTAPAAGLILVYDGQCPFCSTYARTLRVEQAAGRLTLVDARGNHPVLAEIRERGLDLDEGMVLVSNGEFHHGAECLNRLALLASGSNAASRLNRRLFRSSRIAALAYPLLRFGRNAALRLMGRPRIGQPRIGRPPTGDA